MYNVTFYEEISIQSFREHEGTQNRVQYSLPIDSMTCFQVELWAAFTDDFVTMSLVTKPQAQAYKSPDKHWRSQAKAQ